MTAVAAVATLSLGATPALAQTSAGGASAATATTAAPTTSTPRTASSGTATALTRATIRAVQRKLGQKADGAIGAKTRTALRRYQRRNDLTVTGRMDSATLKDMGIDVEATPAPSATGTAASTGSAPTDAGAAPTADQAAILEPIAQCESGGDPTAVSPSGQYHGKYQFSLDTWAAVGGTGDPAAAPEAEQDARAARLLETQGPDAWPVCSKQ